MENFQGSRVKVIGVLGGYAKIRGKNVEKNENEKSRGQLQKKFISLTLEKPKFLH